MENEAQEMVAVFSSSNHDAEMEALNIKAMLEASGVEAMVIGPAVLPNLEFQVQVSEELAEKAQALIDEAKAAGPEAAAEAEAQTE
jgi:predicted xylose isomerase-like sugar epimerase